MHNIMTTDMIIHMHRMNVYTDIIMCINAYQATVIVYMHNNIICMEVYTDLKLPVSDSI